MFNLYLSTSKSTALKIYSKKYKYPKKLLNYSNVSSCNSLPPPLVVTRWSSHSEAMLQAALDDVDWDMFRASSSDVSEFTDVALSFVNTLTEQATETIAVRTFPNQKPWVDRTIRDAVNKRTAAYNAGLLSGNMSEYKASCYALRRAVRAAKLRYRERIESHFQLNDSRRMWQGLPLETNLPQR